MVKGVGRVGRGGRAWQRASLARARESDDSVRAEKTTPPPHATRAHLVDAPVQPAHEEDAQREAVRDEHEARARAKAAGVDVAHEVVLRVVGCCVCVCVGLGCVWRACVFVRGERGARAALLWGSARTFAPYCCRPPSLRTRPLLIITHQPPPATTITHRAHTSKIVQRSYTSAALSPLGNR